MKQQDLAFVARVLAQATGDLTGDPVTLEAAASREWERAHLDRFVLAQAHKLDAQLAEKRVAREGA